MRDLTFRKPAAKSANRVRKKRNWKAIGRRFLMVSCYLFLVALAGTGGFYGVKYLRQADIFRLERIYVENNLRVSEEDILAAAEVKPGMNLLDIDPREIGFRIERLDWVKTAAVERIFPRELRIRLEERNPLAVVKLDHFYYLDGDGTPFKLLEVGDRLDFPVVTGIDRERFLSDAQVSRKIMPAVLQLLAELRQRRFFTSGEVSEIHVDQQGELHLFAVAGGMPIRLGRDLFTGKLDRLERIYADLKPRLSLLQGIDLNVPGQVIVKLRPGSAK
ncbi:MAG: FtsQ-type POTRA domain-containing protein [Deltaproteobacteria bacterium]|nr:FtsQ-type POTRA domain-containing protein [Deltaproteobacteria bacterium]